MGRSGTVKCRFSKCLHIHESKELNKSGAIEDGKGMYYHPDCYEIKTKVGKIKDYFLENINPNITNQQTGALISILYDLVLEKHFDIDYIGYAIAYMAKNKPGVLRYPAGLHYVVQDKQILQAWKLRQEAKMKSQMLAEQERIKQEEEDSFEFSLPEETVAFKASNRKTRFSSILG